MLSTALKIDLRSQLKFIPRHSFSATGKQYAIEDNTLAIANSTLLQGRLFDERHL